MQGDYYDLLERGEDNAQTLFRLQQSAPPQVFEARQNQQNVAGNGPNRRRQNSDSEDYDEDDNNSSYSSESSQNSQQIEKNKIRFFENQFVKVIPKKNTEFKMFSTPANMTMLSSYGFPRSTKQALFAKFDTKSTTWSIYLDEKSKNSDQPAAFQLIQRDNKREWVLWSSSCEKCFAKKRCQPYTDRRQWLMYIKLEVDQESENAFHVLQVLIPTSDDDLKSHVMCPRTMDKKDSRFDYNSRNFTYYELAKKENTLPEDCFYLRTKLPLWNEKMKQFAFDSYGRIKAPSKRNFQMLFDAVNFSSQQEIVEQYSDKDYFPILQLGKTSTSNYILDYRHPISFVQAFAIALSTSTWKSNVQ